MDTLDISLFLTHNLSHHVCNTQVTQSPTRPCQRLKSRIAVHYTETPVPVTRPSPFQLLRKEESKKE